MPMGNTTIYDEAQFIVDHPIYQEECKRIAKALLAARHSEAAGLGAARNEWLKDNAWRVTDYDTGDEFWAAVDRLMRCSAGEEKE